MRKIQSAGNLNFMNYFTAPHSALDNLPSEKERSDIQKRPRTTSNQVSIQNVQNWVNLPKRRTHLTSSYDTLTQNLIRGNYNNSSSISCRQKTEPLNDERYGQSSQSQSGANLFKNSTIQKHYTIQQQSLDSNYTFPYKKPKFNHPSFAFIKQKKQAIENFYKNKYLNGKIQISQNYNFLASLQSDNSSQIKKDIIESIWNAQKYGKKTQIQNRPNQMHYLQSYHFQNINSILSSDNSYSLHSSDRYSLQFGNESQTIKTEPHKSNNNNQNFRATNFRLADNNGQFLIISYPKQLKNIPIQFNKPNFNLQKKRINLCNIQFPNSEVLGVQKKIYHQCKK